MPTKDELYQIIAAYGLGRTLPAGSTRAAARKATTAIVKTGKIVVPAAAGAARAAAPPLARGALQVARAIPYATAALLGYGAYESGLLDPVTESVQDQVVEPIVTPIKRSGRRSRTKFNRAISAGMTAVRSSKFYGKKGAINNAKRAFSAVTKTASKVNAGKKVSSKGVTGTIKRAVMSILR